MQKINNASSLVKTLAEVEARENKSTVMGFNEGPKKNGKIITLHFENGNSQSYTESELFEKGQTYIRSVS